MQTWIVAVIILLAAAYAVRTLAPARLLTRLVSPVAAGLRRRGQPALARWVERYAGPASSCGGCDGCGTDAPSGTPSTTPSVPKEVPIRIVRRRS